MFDKWEIVSGDFAITDNGFTMPESNVTIRATFKTTETPEPEGECVRTA